jgi:hypothetical protein
LLSKVQYRRAGIYFNLPRAVEMEIPVSKKTSDGKPPDLREAINPHKTAGGAVYPVILTRIPFVGWKFKEVLLHLFPHSPQKSLQPYQIVSDFVIGTLVRTGPHKWLVTLSLFWTAVSALIYNRLAYATVH